MTTRLFFSRFRAAVVLAAAIVVAGSATAAERLFTLQTAGEDLVIVEWDPVAVRAATTQPGRRIVDRFPLRSDLEIDLEIEPFSVTSPTSRFVRGRKGLPDEPIEFDPGSISLFRGRVVGRPGSHVFLALSETESTGVIDLGPGHKRYRVASRRHADETLPPGRVVVFETKPATSLPPDVPLCGVEAESELNTLAPSTDGTPVPVRGLKHLQLAVETDHELFVLFGESTATLTYVTQMYAQVSDIYMRDVDTRIELSFVRIWDNADDLFNVVDPSPLSDFQNYWNTNMGGVTRDIAQLFSGRRDYPFGGQAYLSALCGSSGYSVVGYAMGFFPDPSNPSPYSYDISVTAHEIGHNAGTGHTHDSPNSLDTCNDPQTTAQRGTIMSYCSQTWSGGNANRDLYFHSRIQQNIDSHINNSSCVVDDCNQNGISDSTDIQQSTSTDANGSGIPDECEDCNNNLVLDDTDISQATSLDLNLNGIPDECEPDCNSNNIPDDKDIDDLTSADAYGNDIPDECEADCDTDSISDYTEIQGNMPLDIDRSAALDVCQDCDTDGTPDLDALDNSHFAWVASGELTSAVRQFHPITGVLSVISSGGASALADEGFDLIVAPSGNVLVTSHGDHRVMEFDPGGVYLGDLVAPSAGGLTLPTGLIVAPDDATLLVSSEGTNSVLAYDVVSGASQGAFVAAASGGLSGPFGLIFGPNGNLFVTSDTNEVLEFDGQNGSFVGVFVSSADNGGLDRPRGIAFKPDGNLLVASFGTNETLEFDGQTGTALGKWAQVGTATVLTQESPWGVRVGPNGNVFVARTGPGHGSGASSEQDNQANDDELHLSNAQIYEFDARNGNFLRTYVGGNDHGLHFPTGFDFVPGWEIDCNFSMLPDDCDIALGFSDDLDMNGTPDECEVDCNFNGTYDRLDIIPYGVLLDCNNNLSPDTCDVSGGVSQDCTGNGIPDECERDCNANGIADSCDIDAATSLDCNSNGIPDECDVFDDFETDTGWTVGAPGDSATTGVWTRVDPNGTAAQPEDDHTPGGTTCFVTGQGAPGGGLGDQDVDGGATTLTSPVFDVSADPDAEMGYWRWFSNDTGGSPNEDVLTVDISDDGGVGWTLVETVGPTGGESSGGWFFHSFRVADFVTPTNNVVLRFIASDLGTASLVEAAIDDLAGIAECCQTAAVEVDALILEKAAMTRLTWSGQGPGLAYDVVSGDLTSLLLSGGTDDALCQIDDSGQNTWDDPRADPAAGEGYYYLVRSEDSCAPGPYGSATSGAERLPLNDCS